MNADYERGKFILKFSVVYRSMLWNVSLNDQFQKAAISAPGSTETYQGVRIMYKYTSLKLTAVQFTHMLKRVYNILLNCTNISINPYMAFK